MDIWKHGKYLDTWSLVHFLSGVLIADGLYGMGYSFLASLLISVVAITIWEIYEWVTGIIEPGANVLVDLLVGGAGFALGSAYHYYWSMPFSKIGFYTLLSVTLALSLWGFFDFIKRGYR